MKALASLQHGFCVGFWGELYKTERKGISPFTLRKIGLSLQWGTKAVMLWSSTRLGTPASNIDQSLKKSSGFKEAGARSSMAEQSTPNAVVVGSKPTGSISCNLLPSIIFLIGGLGCMN